MSERGGFEIGAHAKRTLCVFGAAVVVFLAQAWHSPYPMLNGNENSHIRLLHSMVVLETLAIAPYADVSYFNGSFYSNKPPIYPMLLSPGYHVLVEMTGDRSLDLALYYMKAMNVLFNATTIALLYLLLASFALRPASIAFGVAAACAGTIFPAYSALANSTPISVMLAMSVLAMARASFLWPDVRHTRTIGLLAASLCVTVHYPNLFFLLPVAAWIGIDVLKRREIVPLVMASIPVVLLLAYNYVVFENPLSLSYSHYVPPKYVAWEGSAGSFSLGRIPNGLYGLLLSPGRGLFVLSPIALFGVYALIVHARARSFDRLWIAAPVVSGILIVSAYALWHGGHSVGHRHILLSGFVLAAFSAFSFEGFSTRGRALAAVVLLASFVGGFGAYLIHRNPVLLRETWKEEPLDVHSDFHRELLVPAIAAALAPPPPDAPRRPPRTTDHARNQAPPTR